MCAAFGLRVVGLIGEFWIAQSRSSVSLIESGESGRGFSSAVSYLWTFGNWGPR